ncbi:hypothetical protein V8G54_029371 [Vigna mungo]|uniref:Uncharacterized protein n=1 Tax=Vigna mungo TaxID=3915 RepID=A0AAQ3MU40_VIGMU
MAVDDRGDAGDAILGLEGDSVVAAHVGDDWEHHERRRRLLLARREEPRMVKRRGQQWSPTEMGGGGWASWVEARVPHGHRRRWEAATRGVPRRQTPTLVSHKVK